MYRLYIIVYNIQKWVQWVQIPARFSSSKPSFISDTFYWQNIDADVVNDDFEKGSSGIK